MSDKDELLLKSMRPAMQSALGLYSARHPEDDDEDDMMPDSWRIRITVSKADNAGQPAEDVTDAGKKNRNDRQD